MKEVLHQGAEAIITRRGEQITKKRIEKSYRIKEIDEKIRKLRTRSEARILERASKFIPVPKVLKVNEDSKEIIMEAIEGKRLSDFLSKFPIKKQKDICERIGENISKLHNENIIHGDLTPSNMILVEDKMPASQMMNDETDNDNKKSPNDDIRLADKRHIKRGDNIIANKFSSKRGDINLPDFKIFFIDFGLGFISPKIEDKAVDLHLLREAFEAGFAENWEILFDSVKEGYSKDYKDHKLVLERLKAVEKRGRYKQGS